MEPRSLFRAFCGHIGREMVWVLGYGSLMWDGWQTSFGCTRCVPASLPGFSRAFNKASVANWGSRGIPGPTLGPAPAGDWLPASRVLGLAAATGGGRDHPGPRWTGGLIGSTSPASSLDWYSLQVMDGSPESRSFMAMQSATGSEYQSKLEAGEVEPIRPPDRKSVV